MQQVTVRVFVGVNPIQAIPLHVGHSLEKVPSLKFHPRDSRCCLYGVQDATSLYRRYNLYYVIQRH